jgi:DNA-binding IclR family transcriptional regulator
MHQNVDVTPKTPSPATSQSQAPESAPAGLSAKTSLARTVGLLNLFTPEAPMWATDELIAMLGMSRSTGYRSIKALVGVGLLAPVSNNKYILGPRIVVMDRQIRQSDPLYNAGGPVMQSLVAETGYSSLLCALYSRTVLCVREELTDASPEHLLTRGQERPLFRGALSKIMLPYLRPHQLRYLYAKHSATIAEAGLGMEWPSFRSNLAKIKADGYVKTSGEFNPGVVGISAPIFNRDDRILGSIGVVGNEDQFSSADEDRCVMAVIQAGKEVSQRLRASDVGVDQPARAVG